MTEADLQTTPSKRTSDRYTPVSIPAPAPTPSTLEGEGEAPDSAIGSAYYAPPYPRAQADRDHQQESLSHDRERGDLTAHNLELIPDADHVAPGIRLDRGGNDYLYHSQDRTKLRDGSSKLATQSVEATEGQLLLNEGEKDERFGKRSSFEGQPPSSIGATGRSSNGGAGLDLADDGNVADDDGRDMYEDVGEGIEDDFDEKEVSIVHERVGGSGATSQNASKGTSVGHFGPRGEEIPGVPPHLDPRQPHFRPPSPGAASVLSVAVHPPASPKMHSASGLGSGSGLTASLGSEVNDSGEETESFENGAMTPTLSEDIDEEENLEKEKLDRSGDAGSSMAAASLSDPTNPFNFGRLNLGSSPQVSFDPNVLSHDVEAMTGLSRIARAPSIAATAGSSRAPSTRGLSPPVSLSRATTNEGSSLEEYGSAGTGIGESGAETPSIVRSRRSSYSAPSSEVEATGGVVGMEGGDNATRSRGATLVASANRLGSSSTGNLHDEHEDDMRDGPSLAPSEAGSDSTRSMTQDSSSVGHGVSYAGIPLGGGIASNERLSSHLYPSTAGITAPDSTAPVDSMAGLGGKSSLHPVLPSLLAIKKANRRNGSGAASTAATAGTASPSSSLSIDGDFEEAGTGIAEA